MKEPGLRIKYLRTKANMSQKDLATKIGISNVALCRYESGEREPDYETLEKIADSFDVSIDYLIGRTDNPTIKNHQAEEAGFQNFKKNIEREEWLKQLQNEKEEDIEKLKLFWEIIKAQ